MRPVQIFWRGLLSVRIIHDRFWNPLLKPWIWEEKVTPNFQIVWKMDVTDWDSNYGESTQMLLKKTQIKSCCHIELQRGEGNLSAFQYMWVFISYFLWKITKLLNYAAMVHTIRSPLHISKCYPLGRDTWQRREKSGSMITSIFYTTCHYYIHSAQSPLSFPPRCALPVSSDCVM